MANRYVITGGGSVVWTAIDTSIWSDTSGGATGASVPGASDVVIMDGASGGGTVTLGYDATISSLTGGAFTGTFNHGGFNLTSVTYNISGTATRTFTLGTGTLELTGNNATLFNVGVATNLTLNKTGSTIKATYAGAVGTRTFGGTAVTYENVWISAGTDIVTFTNNSVFAGNLDFTGFAGTRTTGNYSVGGNLTLGAGMTVTDGAINLTMNATSGTKTITTNGVTLGGNLVIDGVGGTFRHEDDFTCARAITVTNGTHLWNSKNLNITAYNSTNSNTRVITAGDGNTLELSASGTAFTFATATGLTFNPGTSTIKLTNTSATTITFAGGGKTFNRLWIARGASTAITLISGSNTFNEVLDLTSTEAHEIRITTGTNQSVYAWNVRGSVGKLVTLQSSTTTPATLTKLGGGMVSMDYMNVAYITFAPANSWFIGANSTDGTNNTNAYFTAPTLRYSTLLGVGR